MFTTGAHNCQYVFLITNTDPDAPKHQSLTMFLVPLDLPGIEIQGIRTVDGDRTNIVYYSDVRVDDKYRLGEVNGGWTVLREPLNAEHGAVDASTDGLKDVSIMLHQGGFMVTACDRAAKVVGTPDPNGRRPVAEGSLGTDGAVDDGAAEYVYRFAPLVGIYGGTLEVFRNMIAQYMLGLGKPNYSPPSKGL
ncbi:MAG: hypothetical protein QOI01_6490 [Mycobacterium sp.]|jgi:alkylation response protein AidB-like acyl-CoA dehydrogenase|nr:hypothetical protein [Mycobacterium sp.]